jgi:hypothetical protein
MERAAPLTGRRDRPEVEGKRFGPDLRENGLQLNEKVTQCARRKRRTEQGVMWHTLAEQRGEKSDAG